MTSSTVSNPDGDGVRDTRAASSTRVLGVKEFNTDADLRQSRRSPGFIGPYRILRQLGRGGMGSVYLGEPAASCPVPMGRMVAIKVLHRTDQEERKRFEREAAYLQSLRHPGIVRVLDVGEHEDQPFLVMQLIDGKRLDDLVLKSPLPEREAAEMAVQALEALHVAHLAGILHRDIKPGNIMVDRSGTVKLLDFGLASHMHHESRLTRTGNVVGTPAYMSPEQAGGERDAVTRRSDVYSMGACLYELVTAMQPYTADNSVAMLRRIIDEPLVAPSRLRPTLSRDLETIILVAMAKDQRDRYPTAEAMAADLRRFLAGLRIKARTVSTWTLLARTAWRRRRTIAGTGLAAFLITSTTTLGILHLLKINRAVQVAAREHVQPRDEWTTEKRVDADIGSPESDLKVSPYSPLGEGVRLATLPQVKGSVRLSVTVTLITDDCRVELYINDRDVGRGYRLRLQGGAQEDRLVLMREDTVVSSRSLTRLRRGSPWRMCLERRDATISASFADETPLRYLDLVPIEGSKAKDTFVSYAPGTATIRQLLLERPVRGQLVSALAPGNALFEEESYHNAIDEYSLVIQDQPNTPAAREAKLRIALCLEKQNDFAGAMSRFLDISKSERNERAYALTAVFHAWSCALRLGDYERAEQLFTQIRRDYDLQSLAPSIPEGLLTGLLQDYNDRASKTAESDPAKALTLYTTASELGSYLKLADSTDQARMGAGDVQLVLGHLEEAKGLYAAAAADTAALMASRMLATLKIAEVERLMDHVQQAETSYLTVIANAVDPERAQWARLYLGDLYLEQNQKTQALATWKASTEIVTLPGQIMARLIEGTGAMPANTDRYYANDVAYFEGRLALLSGQEARYRQALHTVISIGPAADWPTPLAKHLLDRATTPATSAP